MTLTWCLSSLISFILMVTRWDFFHRFKDSHRNDLTLQLKSPRISIRILKQMNSCLPDLTYCPSARLRCELQVNSKKKDSARNKKTEHLPRSVFTTRINNLWSFRVLFFLSVWNCMTFHNFFFITFSSFPWPYVRKFSKLFLFLPNSVQQTQTLVFNKMPFMLFNYFSLCYSVLALPCAVTNDFNFPRVSVTGNKIPEISWLSRFSMTRTDRVPCFQQLDSWLLP